MYKSIKPTDFVDFHTHTTASDGFLSPQELIDEAKKVGISYLAITDHNQITDITELKRANPDILLIQGVEISAIFEATEIHIVGLGVRSDSAPLNALLAYNREGRRKYITAILDKLRACGIDLGSFDDLLAKYPNTHQPGRMHIASELIKIGAVENSTDAFTFYLGTEGIAYVKNPHQFVPLSTAVKGIHQAGGIPILAHPFYYELDYHTMDKLFRKFEDLSHLLQKPFGVEVFYPTHSRKETECLKWLAKDSGFLMSAASDYHANGADFLNTGYTAEMCTELLNALGIEIE